MDFGWFKNIFKKKNLSNTNTSDISTIDTSFIRVPKISELSYEDRLLLEKYITELKTASKDNDYETVLKYSDKLLNKSNSEIEFFMISLDDILKVISSVINEVNKENYFKLLLSKEEIKQSIDEFYKIIEETKLRLLALDTYIKKEELRKYDFLGVFGKAERLKYLNDKSKLSNERDRLKTTIKISSMHLLATFKALKEDEVLLNNMEMYINGSKTFNTNQCDYEMCEKYAKNLLSKKKRINKDDCKELEYLVGICEDIWGIYRGLCVGPISNQKMDELLSNLEFKKIVPFLAKEKREIKKYAFEHRNDYKKIIEGINEVVKKYQTTSSSKWNKVRLEKIIRDYVTISTNYVIVCNKYLSDDILKQLRESLFSLNYFFNISEVRRDRKKGNMSPLGKSLILGEYTGSIIKYGNIKYCDKVIHDLLEKIDGWDWEYEDEKKYYDKLSCEMLKTVGILNLPLSDYKNLERRIERIVKELKYKEELHYLFDIYNNDYSDFNLYIDNEKLYSGSFVEEHSLYSKKGLGLYEKVINNKYFRNYPFCQLYFYEGVFLGDIFYLDKFLNSRGLIIDEMFNSDYEFAQGISKDLFKILVYSYFKYLDLQSNERIFVIPSQVKFNQVSEFKPLLKSLNELSINDNHIAIYLTNWGQVNAIHRVLKEEEAHIKYLIMSNELYDLYRNVYEDDLNQKIIVVPIDTDYSELANYLNQELEKENNTKKILK